MPDNGFAAGEADAYGAGGPPISQQESIGATYKIVHTIPGSRGAHVQQRSDYLMPPTPTPWNGEPVTPAIELTPLGTAGPGFAMPEPQVYGYQGAFPCNETNGQFGVGVADAYPEGSPVPVNSR